MNSKAIYPLEQIIEVKKKRVDQAEKVVKEKESALQKEQEKLAERENARDKEKNHYQDKLAQLRAIMDEGTTSPKIQQMKVYLKIVHERLKIEEKKVKEQKEFVVLAEQNLQKAKAELREKRKEVDKFLDHKKEWQKEQRKELEIIEGREQDELGSTIFIANKRKYG
jgi:flagellar biosynthesis chaperone FliJ